MAQKYSDQVEILEEINRKLHRFSFSIVQNKTCNFLLISYLDNTNSWIEMKNKQRTLVMEIFFVFLATGLIAENVTETIEQTLFHLACSFGINDTKFNKQHMTFLEDCAR
jgi:hypothetical protein